MSIKRKEIKLEKITLTISCEYCNNKNDIIVNGDDFDGSESDCETCGSHGSVSVFIKCPSCGKMEDVIINSW